MRGLALSIASHAWTMHQSLSVLHLCIGRMAAGVGFDGKDSSKASVE